MKTKLIIFISIILCLLFIIIPLLFNKPIEQQLSIKPYQYIAKVKINENKVISESIKPIIKDVNKLKDKAIKNKVKLDTLISNLPIEDSTVKSVYDTTINIFDSIVNKQYIVIEKQTVMLSNDSIIISNKDSVIAIQIVNEKNNKKKILKDKIMWGAIGGGIGIVVTTIAIIAVQK